MSVRANSLSVVFINCKRASYRFTEVTFYLTLRMYMIADFAVEHPVCPPQQCENICPFQQQSILLVPLNNARTSAPLRVGTPTFNRLTSHAWSSLFLYRHASCACIHTCHCFKILFPAIDPYASSPVVLQSLMKYSPHLRMCLQNVCPQA